MDKAFITSINGPAVGAGLGLAVWGDLALSAASAHFSISYTAIALTPDGGKSSVLSRLIDLRQIQEMALTNRPVSIAEAALIGLVSSVVQDPNLQTLTQPSA
jgi:2-(1,2-epoxy-1,2-dihydrophenyl)acetyl-CoA isomerase